MYRQRTSSFQLTSLVTGLMTRLWCRKADPLFITVLAHLGPLAEFECLVSCHGYVLGGPFSPYAETLYVLRGRGELRLLDVI